MNICQLTRGGSRLKSDCCKYIDDTNLGGSKFGTPETAFPAFERMFPTILQHTQFKFHGRIKSQVE